MTPSLFVAATIILLNQASGLQLPLAGIGGRRTARPSPSASALDLSHDHSSESSAQHRDADSEAPTLSRRRLLGRAFSSAAAASSLALVDPSIASAKVTAAPFEVKVGDGNLPAERDELLRAISNRSSDEVIAGAIERLVPLSPLKGGVASKSTVDAALDGEWKLLWYNYADFSPLLKLPPPFQPASYQYFGGVAEREVGEGRVAQGLVGGVLSALGPETEVWLSSGAVARGDRPSALEIYPPFRFQLGRTPGSSSAPKRMIVEAGSDAEFRRANARTTEAQLAPKNEYEQLYLEDVGTGSLRVSLITKGDPVIVGDMFVHQKL